MNFDTNNYKNASYKFYFFLRIFIAVFIFTLSIFNSITGFIVSNELTDGIIDKSHLALRDFHDFFAENRNIKLIITAFLNIAFESLIITTFIHWFKYSISAKLVIDTSYFLLVKVICGNLFKIKSAKTNLMENLWYSFSFFNNWLTDDHVVNTILGISLICADYYFNNLVNNRLLVLSSAYVFILLYTLFKLSLHNIYFIDMITGVFTFLYLDLIPYKFKLIHNIDRYLNMNFKENQKKDIELILLH